MEKILLTLDEFCAYLGIGKTKAREMVKDKKCTYSVKYGNRWMVVKPKLDEHINKCVKYGISIA